MTKRTCSECGQEMEVPKCEKCGKDLRYTTMGGLSGWICDKCFDWGD